MSFNISKFRINPGLASVFPWLSAVAARYETYEFNKLLFRYHPRVPTTTSGIVGGYFDFDVSDEASASVIEVSMQSTERHTSTWNTLDVPVNPAFGPYKWRYIRGGFYTGSSEDEKLHDIGAFCPYDDGCNASNNTILGYWEVDYVITLKTPQFIDPVGGLWTSVAVSQNSLFGSGMTPFGHSVSPYHTINPTTIQFDEPYQGTMTLYNTGNDVNSHITCALAGAATSAVTTIWYCLTSNVRALHTVALRVVAGDQITFSSMTPAITGFSLCLAKAAYDSLK